LRSRFWLVVSMKRLSRYLRDAYVAVMIWVVVVVTHVRVLMVRVGVAAVTVTFAVVTPLYTVTGAGVLLLVSLYAQWQL
jgi:hypothetical protein